MKFLCLAIFCSSLFGEILTQTSPENDDAATPDPFCPYPSTNYTFYPYPGDCTKYIECYNGNKIISTCPAGERWSQDKLTCDFAANVPCDDDDSSTTTSLPTSSTSEIPTTTTTTTTDEITTNTTPSPTTSTPSETTITTTSDSTTENPNVTTSSPPWTPDPLCPYPSDELYFFPDPYDCTKYYECFEGNKYVMECPDNERWNQDQQTCDFASNVPCDEISSSSDVPSNTTTSETTASSSTSTSIAPDPTTQTPPETTTGNPNVTTTSSPWTPDPLCPYPSDDIYFFPDPYDCTKYYECYEGNKFVMECPSGERWNQDQQTCDFAANVPCEEISSTDGPSTTPSNDTTPTEEPTSTANSTATTAAPETTTTNPDVTTSSPPWTPDPLCPYPSDEVYFFPDPYDCTKYYECYEGKKFVMECPGGERWNQDQQTCDFASNVPCDEISSTASPSK